MDFSAAFILLFILQTKKTNNSPLVKSGRIILFMSVTVIFPIFQHFRKNEILPWFGLALAKNRIETSGFGIQTNFM